jgi:hypothetical protein
VLTGSLRARSRRHGAARVSSQPDDTQLIRTAVVGEVMAMLGMGDGEASWMIDLATRLTRVLTATLGALEEVLTDTHGELIRLVRLMLAPQHGWTPDTLTAAVRARDHRTPARPRTRRRLPTRRRVRTWRGLRGARVGLTDVAWRAASDTERNPTGSPTRFDTTTAPPRGGGFWRTVARVNT